MLLVVSKADHNVSIELGPGWGQQYEVQKLIIIRKMMTPSFNQDNLENDILEGVIMLNSLAVGLDLPKQSQRLNVMANSSPLLHLSFLSLFKYILLCSIVIYIFSIFKNNQRQQ